MLSRTDRNALSDWWWTVDRTMLAALAALISIGLILSLAASPAVAERINLSSFYFVERQAMYLVPAIAVMIGVSLLDERQGRRAALVIFVIGCALMVATLFVGAEVKGARRWLSVGGVNLQPSEFVKPAFVVLVAWLFAERIKRPDMPGNLLAFVLLGIFVALLVPQPDFGQTMLATLVWGALFFAAGLSWIWIFALAGIAAMGIVLAYFMLRHVRERIDGFLTPGSADTYQVDRSLEAFVNGGWLGRGPGEGIVKQSLPDSHADFVFAVAGEEFGAVACMLLVLLFAFIVLRGIGHAGRSEDPYPRLAITGLVVLFGLQSVINMAVNLSLMPAKGMTLPFVSFGGSSIISLAYAMGMVLGLSRRRAQAAPIIKDLVPGAGRA
ncbi:putative lipid II flippase FtsW [Lutibaculum baratangense]|uniref:Probable peptidoglycan glycosyltransferase FtsW n=1 Tax=Lutibaculum baratangense AMV1 TaxID=631454 RepID=V4R5V1_9HYPH|nr:putative lipid II flippase FtsW [Lutibaculum baratangense]ESR27332.1 Cell division protein FtsW [Lutibaculum baratangense AMV1]